MSRESRKERWLIILAFSALYVIWGSTYYAVLIVIKTIPPLLMTGLRFCIAGILLFAWCLYKRDYSISLKNLFTNSFCGILALFGGTGSIAWAEQYLPSSVVAIIVSSLPFWFVLLDKRQWNFYFSNKFILMGLFTGFVGVLILLGINNNLYLHQSNALQKAEGTLFVIAGGVAWTIGSLYIKYHPAQNSLLMNASMQLLAAGLFCFLVGTITGESGRMHFDNITAQSWLALFYLVIFGSVITYVSFLWLLEKRPAAQVSTYVYVNPVIALILGGLFANERITSLQVVALFIILGGVLLVNIPKYKGLAERVNLDRIRKARV